MSDILSVLSRFTAMIYGLSDLDGRDTPRIVITFPRGSAHHFCHEISKTLGAIAAHPLDEPVQILSPGKGFTFGGAYYRVEAAEFALPGETVVSVTEKYADAAFYNQKAPLSVYHLHFKEFAETITSILLGQNSIPNLSGGVIKRQRVKTALVDRLSKLPKVDTGISWQMRNWRGSEEMTVHGVMANCFKWVLDNRDAIIEDLSAEETSPNVASVLDQPARVGATTFGVGVAVSTVINAATRLYVQKGREEEDPALVTAQEDAILLGAGYVLIRPDGTMERMDPKSVELHLQPVAVERDDICPDCRRPKAKSVDDAAAGHCPKWWAVRDADADRDCERHASSATDGRKFNIRDRVSKKSGSSWNGRVVGFYSTELTPIGYCVESEREPGSVQLYPEAALQAASEAR